MNCPRCQASLTNYALGGRTASVCEDCGYVGVDVDHASERAARETWSDAIRRFYAAFDDEGGRPDDAEAGGDDRATERETGSGDDRAAEDDGDAGAAGSGDAETA